MSNSESTGESSSTSRAFARKHACAAFLAGDILIRIIPSFNYGALGLISRPVGPFLAGVDVTVPLWLGCMLRQKGLARIIAPDWMEVDYLQQILNFERDPAEASFSPNLPHAYLEIARAILLACTTGNSGGNSTLPGGETVTDYGGGREEVPNANQVKLLLEDISTVRMDKIRRNVHTLSNQTLSKEHQVPIIDVTGIGALEILAVRPFLQTAFRDQNMITKVPAVHNTLRPRDRAEPHNYDNVPNQPQNNRIRRYR